MTKSKIIQNLEALRDRWQQWEKWEREDGHNDSAEIIFFCIYELNQVIDRIRKIISKGEI